MQGQGLNVSVWHSMNGGKMESAFSEAQRLPLCTWKNEQAQSIEGHGGVVCVPSRHRGSD